VDQQLLDRDLVQPGVDRRVLRRRQRGEQAEFPVPERKPAVLDQGDDGRLALGLETLAMRGGA
jgi:hypothetical protein